jgi:putative drug exporter of the RND superfamily
VSARLGAMGRLGHWAAENRRLVFAGWAVLVIALGIFAPRVEQALSGAGWEATGSESVQARDVVDREFDGLSSSALMVVVHSEEHSFESAEFRAAVARIDRLLEADDAVTSVVPPRPGISVAADGHTAVVRAGAARGPNDMVRAADRLKGRLDRAGGGSIDVSLTGASGMWSDFNAANKEAMLKSELISWPVTLVIMIVAFGSLVAAGLPLMLTIIALVAAAGSLFLGTQLLDISIWAMNFALMFALALGIDYALFIVYRFRGALFGSKLPPAEATAVAMDTAGKAVLFSGLTVLISLSAVMLVPSPAFRSMSLGIMLAVAFVLLASLTLLPAVLGSLGARVDRLGLPWVHSGEHRSARFAGWASLLSRRPLALGAVALTALVLLALPVLGLRTSMPSIKVVPEDDGSRQGYEQVQAAFGPGAPGALQIVVPRDQVATATAMLRNNQGTVRAVPAPPARGDHALIEVVPATDPSDPALGRTVDQLRASLPAGVLVGGAAAENHDLEDALAATTAPVIAVVLGLGFLLLLVALRAPVLAALGVLTNLLAVGAAFGAAKLIFQDGNLQGLLGFESQGFMDAWAPVFFFAMIFAISMDYTVFLLSAAREHRDRGESALDAMVGGVAHSGRVILAAAAVMVAVFFTFALSGPLPPKEMGVVLGLAVLLDAALVRLLLLPVLLRLLGERAWWLPRPLARLLPNVRFGHA